MGVSKQLQVGNFSLHPPGHVPVDQFLPRNNLQGDFLARNLVYRELNLAKRALAEGPDDFVLTQASLWFSVFVAGILTGVRVLARVVVTVGSVVRAVRVGGGLRVLLLLLLLFLLLLGGWGRNTVWMVGTLLAAVSRNGELALCVRLRHGEEVSG